MSLPTSSLTKWGSAPSVPAQQQLNPQFEALIAAMRTAEVSDAQTERKGAEWVRDLFLRRIANAEKMPRSRKKPSPAVDTLDIQL